MCLRVHSLKTIHPPHLDRVSLIRSYGSAGTKLFQQCFRLYFGFVKMPLLKPSCVLSSPLMKFLCAVSSGSHTVVGWQGSAHSSNGQGQGYGHIHNRGAITNGARNFRIPVWGHAERMISYFSDGLFSAFDHRRIRIASATSGSRQFSLMYALMHGSPVPFTSASSIARQLHAVHVSSDVFTSSLENRNI